MNALSSIRSKSLVWRSVTRWGALLGLIIALAPSPATALLSTTMAQEKLWSVDEQGRFRVKPWPVPDSIRNRSWTAEHEQEFQERADWVIRQTAKPGGYGGTFFEN